MADTTQYCTFYVDGLYFGIDVLQVQEVIRTLSMTEVPLAPQGVKGLINLRGQIVTAIDLRTSLGLTPREDGAEPMNVVVRLDDGAVSLLVDEIGDVIEPDEDAFERTPETLTLSARRLIRGVYKLPDRLLLVLDTALAVNLETVGAGKSGRGFDGHDAD
ncbi:MAG: chemotaxis protein CheW [Gemmatimonas sp.]